MKNLKKLISVIIAVIMLVSSFATVAAADYADVESTNSYYKAIKVLSGLGIAQGDDEGNFNPKNEVKRSEMVAFVCRAMGEEDIATASSSSAFADVAANHWAAGYIAWGVNRGIINGMGDGTFAPDASVSYQDAVVMIMRALGYDRIAQRAENGGYPVGYLKLASQYGVLKDAGYNNTAAATREIIAQLIYNALTAPLVDVQYYGVNVEDDRYIIYNNVKKDGLRTLLTYSNEVYKVKADITATPKSNNGLIDNNGNYKVTLGNLNDYDYDDTVVAILGATPTVYVGETEAANLLGSTVEAYITESEELNDWVLLAVVADAKSTVEETLAAADVEFVSYTSNVFKYLDAKDKEVEIDTVAAPTVYFNGKEISGDDWAANLSKIATKLSVTVDDLEDLLLNVADEVTFMGPKNGDYNKIFVTDYSYAKVVEVMPDELFVKVEIDGMETAIDLDVENRTNDKFAYNIFDANGKAIELADIAEDDILNIVAPLTSSVYDVLATNLDYMDIYVSNETVTGRVDEHVVGSKYVIAGNTYVVLTTVTPGDEGVFYLTIDGKVFDADADSTISKDYAFVVAHDTDESFRVKTHTLRLFKADGTFENLTLAPSVNVYLANPGNSNTYEKVVAKRSDGKQDTLGAYLDGFLVDNASKEWVADALQARVMTYSLNAEGEIKEMRFAGTGSDQFAALEVDGAKYYDDTAVFAGNDLDDKSVLFVAPIVSFEKITCTTEHTHTDGCSRATYYKVDEDELEVSSFDLMNEDKDDGYDAYVFNFENDEFLGAAIVYDKITSNMKFAHLAVVQAKSTGLDAEGDTVDKYTFVQGGEVVQLAVDPEYEYDDDLQAGTEMAAGDVIRYTVDADGEIDAIEHVYDASAETFATAYAYDLLDTNDIAIVYGNISEIKSGKMTLVAKDKDDNPITGADVPGTKLAFNTTEGNTYASIDEARVQGTVAPNTGVKALAGAGNLRASYGSTEFYVVAIVGENNRFEDCVMIIK